LETIFRYSLGHNFGVREPGSRFSYIRKSHQNTFICARCFGCRGGAQPAARIEKIA
jgi:hypothetical protein